MRFRIIMTVTVDALDDREAHAHAVQLQELLREPLVRMAVAGKGISLVADPVVHQPQRES